MKRIVRCDMVNFYTSFGRACRVAVLALLCLTMPEMAFAQFSMEKAENIKLQKALKAKGFFRGRATGTYGRKTRRAVRKFQRSLGHKVTGRLSGRERTRLLGDGENKGQAKIVRFKPYKKTIRVKIGASPDGKKGRLGVNISTPSTLIANLFSDGQKKGAFVENVTSSGAAEKAGIHATDIIIKIDDNIILGQKSLIQTIEHLPI